MSEIIPEPYVKCSFCHNTVSSKFAIRAKQQMVFMGENGYKEVYPAGTTICNGCLKRRGLL